MKWAHLPEKGGIYDQHPMLIQRFYEIMGAVAEQQEREQKKSEANMGGPRAGGPKPSMGGRPRRR